MTDSVSHSKHRRTKAEWKHRLGRHKNPELPRRNAIVWLTRASTGMVYPQIAGLFGLSKDHVYGVVVRANSLITRAARRAALDSTDLRMQRLVAAGAISSDIEWTAWSDLEMPIPPATPEPELCDMTDQAAHKLGAATGRLYQRLQGLLKIATDLKIEPARAALGRIALAVLCGAYHDFRSGRPYPKGDLHDALGAVPPHPALDDQRAAVQAEILAGHYDEDDEEGRRWVAKLMPRRPGQRASQDVQPAAVELTPREWRCFVWLYRYVEVYGQSPMVGEMATGLGVPTNEVREVLRLLETKGAAAHLGGKRGWVPTRTP